MIPPFTKVRPSRGRCDGCGEACNELTATYIQWDEPQSRTFGGQPPLKLTHREIVFYCPMCFFLATMEPDMLVYPTDDLLCPHGESL
jgi:hypothetical protein